MPAERGSFPIAGLTVVALFVSTSFLAPHSFDLWRQLDSDSAQRLELSEPPVEARLWEDPFAALNRHRQKLIELCGPPTAASPPARPALPPAVPAPSAAPTGPPRDVRCQAGQAETAKKFRESFAEGERITLIAAMLPGGSFIGGEEARRRSRYALLAGLAEARYVPDDSEHLGLVQVKRCERLAGCPDEKPAVAAPASTPREGSAPIAASSPKIEVVYEVLRSQDSNDINRRRVVVLWIDETAIGRRWLSTITTLLGELAPENHDVRLRIIGPSGSEGVVRVLDNDLPAMLEEAKTAKDEVAKALRANWQTLNRIRLVSPQSTAPAEQLRTQAHLRNRCLEAGDDGTRVRDCVDEAFQERLGAVRKVVEPDHQGLAKPPSFFIRTVGTDDRLVTSLVNELRARGFDPCETNMTGRVILFNEWDSIYARTFAEGLQRKLDCGTGKVKLDSHPYLRGLDGATLEGVPSQPKRTNDSGRSSSTPQIEWPEGRDQRDYVRRLVQQILDRIDGNDPDSQVRAIGMIGSDVNDKLVLVQALRDAFPDRMVFTTDLDARLLHPSVTRYTRNMIVASSLPLGFAKSPLPPFRDTYQTAMYLAAQHAALFDNQVLASGGGAAPCKTDDGTLACRLQLAVTQPVLFEIGRKGIVQLNGPGAPTPNEEKQNCHTYSVLTGVGLLVLCGLMVVGLPGPAMSAARSWRFTSMPDDRFHLSTMAVAGLQVAALGFAAGVVVELWTPGSFGVSGTLLLGATLMALLWAFVYPGMPRRRDFHGVRSTLWRLAQIAALLLFLFWMASSFWETVAATKPSDTEIGEPFAPLSGVSTWPGQIMRTLLVVLFAWFLDYAWCRSADVALRIEDDYFPAEAGAVDEPRPGRLKRILAAVLNSSIWLWQPKVALPGGSIDGSSLWRQYRLRLRNWPRFGRLVLWMFVCMALLGLAIIAIGGPAPELPARGVGDRSLFFVTLVLASLSVLSLLVLVGDATILTWRFITVLRSGRTVYPRATIGRFAAELGPELRNVAAKRIVPRIVARDEFQEADADPRQALDGGQARLGVPARNSLLDDWIDVRLLAEHTAAIGPLIVFPFILLALWVVSRSQLFDNWQIGGGPLFVMVSYVLWAIAMAFLLNYGAEVARRRAVDRMEADLLWLKGAGPGYGKLAERFPILIEQVRTIRRGAFAPFFEQPLVQAILVPLGGAGGVQLLDFLLYARTQ